MAKFYTFRFSKELLTFSFASMNFFARVKL